MKKQLHLFFALVGFTFTSVVSAQFLENKPGKPVNISKPISVVKVPSIASRATLSRPDLSREVEMQDGRASRYDIIPGKGSSGDDPLWQKSTKNQSRLVGKTPNLVFETASSGAQPSDPDGAVGPNHYVTVTNTAFQIFDKQGNSLTGGLLNTSVIFPQSGCCDLTISYDNLADRYVMSLLRVTTGSKNIQVAISDGPDPVNDSWTVYAYEPVRDYNKLSVWRDGYYVTENTTQVKKVHVFERDKMIQGDPNAQIVSFELPGIVTSGFSPPQAFNIASSDFPTAGGAPVVFLQDDSYNGVSVDHIKMWTVDMDWSNVNNSTISAATEYNVTPFVSVFDGGSFNNLIQPNSTVRIDAIQATIMNQATFRKFTTHNSAVFNFVVDVDGTSAKQAGIRWYEMRQASDTDPWTIYQEGTYTAPDNRNAWMGSMSIDAFGNIALGYSGMSSPNSSNPNIFVGSYYTGRYPTDPLGQMTVQETVIMEGDAIIPGTRYGDYNKMDVDPSDDKSFWFVNELMHNGRKNIAGVFKLVNFNNDVGISNLTAPVDGALTNSEDITVTIFNYGLDPVSNFEVSYQVDGGTAVTETFTGTIQPQTSANYTFSSTADFSAEGHTYSLVSSTHLTNDEDTSNDSFDALITHVFQNDVGISDITAPVSGALGANEIVSATITNYGTSTQTSVPVSCAVDGGTPINETYTGSIASGQSDAFSFATTADMSNLFSNYSIASNTALASDSVVSNDDYTVNVLNKPDVCIPEAIEDCDVDGIKKFVLKDIDADDGADGCNGENGYEDRTHLITDLTISTSSTSTFNVQAQQNWNNGADGDEKFSVWIDLDDSGTFEESERFISGHDFTAAGSLVNFSMVLPADPPQGIHILRAKAMDTTADGDILNPCTDFDYGEVQDYLVNLTLTVGFDEIGIDDPFRIITLSDNYFEISFPTRDFTERLELKVFDMLGQQIYWKSLFNDSGNGYNHILNMSYMPSGVYFVTLGNDQVQESKRIIVE